MPPRKKAATVPSAQSASTGKVLRSSTQATPGPTLAPKPKTRSKRVRGASDSEEDKHTKKKAKGAVEEDESDASQDVDDEPKKMVTVLKRGAAPVDPHSGFVSTHQVYSSEAGVWDAMLNQTDVSQNQNKNKFYVLQLLHTIGNNTQCVLFTRWGRVGENGANQVKGPWPSETAIREFKKQFRAKTAHDWENRHGMVAKKGKYTYLERAFEDEEDLDKGKNKAEGSTNVNDLPDSRLAVELQVLCKLIFSTSLLDAHLSSMNYDARKLPLGKLAKSTILQGFAALKILAEVIEEPDGSKAREFGGLRPACEHLSGSYYSIIPHDFGRARPQIIENLVSLKKELELVDALGDMEVAQKLIQSTILSDESGNALNPLDAHFRSLDLSLIDPIQKNSKEFRTLEKYAKDTHGATHKHYAVNVAHAFRVERESETRAWMDAGLDVLLDGERLLLWHGSRTTNFAGILKQGLRIAPPEAPVTGYMFGKGVYFADMMSKSANYCYAQLSDSTGLLLLCEVAAKPFHEETNANYIADQTCIKNGKKSTKGIGKTQPVQWQDAGKALGNDALKGCHMPAGPGKDVQIPGVYLQYNEYIVYDPSQIRLRYLLMVEMPGAF